MRSVDRLKKNMDSDFWLNGPIAARTVMMAVWGCKVVCPFCKEPCRHSDEDHLKGKMAVSHTCVQHRPAGLSGRRWAHSTKLSHKTCSFNVATQKKFACQCVPKCDKKSNFLREKLFNEQPGFHPYKRYKKYFPNWEIQAERGTVNKYWCWVYARFKDQFVKYYSLRSPVKGADISKDVTEITKEEAVKSLSENWYVLFIFSHCKIAFLLILRNRHIASTSS